MDATPYVIAFIIVVVACTLSVDYFNQRENVRVNKPREDYVNSVVKTPGLKPEDNAELMSQMKPSDSVVSYVAMKYYLPGREINGYIAVTNERLIFKAVAVGDYVSSLNNTFANRGYAISSDLRFDLKEETCNIPISNVTSMSKSAQTFEIMKKGCFGKEQLPPLTAYVLQINAQGFQYKLFLGKHYEIADEFSKSFVSISYNDDEA